MKLEIFHVDSFAEQIFQGNPAAVCILEEWLPDQIMQAIAAELNLSETAFCVKRSDGDFRIRWFTPTTEVKLCGHATLASAHVLFEHLKYEGSLIKFHCLSGVLTTERSQYGLSLDLPIEPVKPVVVSKMISDAVCAQVQEAYEADDLVVVLSDASEVEIYEPKLDRLANLDYRGVCVAAPGNGNGYDFVSRFFAPQSGIAEDPVTGSSFTMLAPIFALKMGKTEFMARQVSTRGGNVHVKLVDDRVIISGHAQTVMQSTMTLPGF